MSRPRGWTSRARAGRDTYAAGDGRTGVKLGIDIGGTGIKGAPVDLETGA